MVLIPAEYRILEDFRRIFYRLIGKVPEEDREIPPVGAVEAYLKRSKNR
jgi:hypothetical protein